MASPQGGFSRFCSTSEPVGRASEPAGRTSEPAGRALKPGGGPRGRDRRKQKKEKEREREREREEEKEEEEEEKEEKVGKKAKREKQPEKRRLKTLRSSKERTKVVKGTHQNKRNKGEKTKEAKVGNKISDKSDEEEQEGIETDKEGNASDEVEEDDEDNEEESSEESDEDSDDEKIYAHFSALIKTIEDTCKKQKIPVPTKRLTNIAACLSKHLPMCYTNGFRSKDDRFFLSVINGTMSYKKSTLDTIEFPLEKLLASLTLSTESLFKFLKARNKHVACYTRDEKYFLRKLVRLSDIFIKNIPCKKIRELCT